MAASPEQGPARQPVLTSAIVNWVGFAAQLVVAFYLAPVLVHGLGDRRYGIWSLIESILAWLTLFDLGVAASVVRYVARFEAVRDTDKLNRVFSTSLAVFAAAGLAALLLALTIAYPGIAWLTRIPAELRGEARLMLVLLGVNLAVGLPLSVFASVLDGLGQYPVKTVIRTAILLGRVPLLLAVVGSGGGLSPLAVVITVSNLLEHTLLALAAWRYLPGLCFAPRLVDRETFRLIRGYSLNAFAAMIAGRISFQTDALVIGAFLAPEFITFFMVAARLVEYAKNSLRAITTVLTPEISRLEALGDAAAIRRIFLNGTRAVLWLILPIQVGFLLLGRPFLTLWLGAEYAASSFPTLALLALPLGLAVSQSVSARVLYGTGELGWFARLVCVEALVNLLLSLALVGPLGIEGVALGTALPNLACNLVLVGWMCRRLQVHWWTWWREGCRLPLLGALVLAAGWWWSAEAATTWVSLLTIGGSGVLLIWGPALLLELGWEEVRRLAGRGLKRAAGMVIPSARPC